MSKMLIHIIGIKVENNSHTFFFTYNGTFRQNLFIDLLFDLKSISFKSHVPRLIAPTRVSVYGIGQERSVVFTTFLDSHLPLFEFMTHLPEQYESRGSSMHMLK